MTSDPKPKIRRQGRWWVCECRLGYVGCGISAPVAFENWLRQMELKYGKVSSGY